MTIVRHELRQGKTNCLIWTASIGMLLAVCVRLFPEMKGEMGEIGDLFSSMGSFTAAFGMDKLNFGSLVGYYAIECGNVLGIGGAFYAAMIASGMLSKEERDTTAEFLLTHPVSRARVVTEKLAALWIQITALNLVVCALSVATIMVIGEEVPLQVLTLMHGAYYLLQLELAGICFGLSAFMRRGSVGLGMGIAAVLYTLNLIANIADAAAFLKWITPFAYCEGADIVTTESLDMARVMAGMARGALGVAAAYYQYTRKDIC